MVAVAAKATTKREVGPPVTLLPEGFVFAGTDCSLLPDEPFVIVQRPGHCRVETPFVQLLSGVSVAHHPCWPLRRNYVDSANRLATGVGSNTRAPEFLPVMNHSGGKEARQLVEIAYLNIAYMNVRITL